MRAPGSKPRTRWAQCPPHGVELKYGRVRYDITGESGPPHDRVFEVTAGTPGTARENVIRAVANHQIADEIKFVYRTQKWEKPAKLVLRDPRTVGDIVTVEVMLVDANGVLCLDARNVVRFAVAGDGRLMDNLGTPTTARKVELYNGRAQISVQRKGPFVVSVSSEGFEPQITRIN